MTVCFTSLPPRFHVQGREGCSVCSVARICDASTQTQRPNEKKSPEPGADSVFITIRLVADVFFISPMASRSLQNARASVGNVPGWFGGLSRRVETTAYSFYSHFQTRDTRGVDHRTKAEKTCRTKRGRDVDLASSLDLDSFCSVPSRGPLHAEGKLQAAI